MMSAGKVGGGGIHQKIIYDIFLMTKGEEGFSQKLTLHDISVNKPYGIGYARIFISFSVYYFMYYMTF